MGKRIMIMAGGTGGHVYPALAVARVLIAEGHEVVWLGTRKGLEARVIPAAGIRIEWLEVAGVRGKTLRGVLGAPWMLLRALWQSFRILKRVNPSLVLGMGGFVSGPGGLVAAFSGIPLVLHEQNRVPGTTNRLLTHCASRVLEAFEGSFASSKGALAVGNPARAEIAALNHRVREDWRDRPARLLVVGGSLGAKILNECVPEALARLGGPLEVRHQTGERLLEETRQRYEALGLEAQIVPFVEDMAAAYAWADLAICRAGAMTVSELALAGLPAILIPYPYAIDDHQTANAALLRDQGGAVLLPQQALTPERLAESIERLLGDRQALRLMSVKARQQARPNAAEVVAEICVNLAREPRPLADQTEGLS